jgi:PKD repeat protein
MKSIRFDVLRVTICVFFVSLLLFASASQAQTVILDGTTATGIEGLQVNQVSFYDVTFLTATANTVYGTNPNQIFPFPSQAQAEKAALAVVIALNNSVADAVGEAGSGERVFNIGWGVNEAETGIWATNGTFVQSWIGPGDRELINFGTAVVYADFVKILPTGNQPPEADAGDPYVGEVGVAVAFDGSGSFDTDGTIASYSWNFGDSGTGTGQSPDHTYATAGVWNVTLEVSDDMGTRDSDSSTADIGAGARPPLADAGGPYISEVGTEITFDGTSSSTPNDGGTIDVYDWDFGDGTVVMDAGPNPTHTYVANDAWPVTVSVTSNTPSSV